MGRLTTEQESLTYGVIHLQVSDPAGSLTFWRDVVGLQPMAWQGDVLVLGTEHKPLVALHPGATERSKRGFSGLYHVALHMPTEQEFARVLGRLVASKWPISPVDHVLHKAIYLSDPDGVGLEIAFETPERVRETGVFNGVPGFIGVDGRFSDGREPIDVNGLLYTVPGRDFDRPVPEDTTIGHVHLHVADLQEAIAFYRDQLGYSENTFVPQFEMADMHVGGFPHRLALNTWQSVGQPQAPAQMAGMRHFTIRYATPEHLEDALGRLPDAVQIDGGHLVSDPSGNRVLLTAHGAPA